MKKLTSSVIICTRNRPDDLARMLSSLREQTMAPTEIIVVDSSDFPAAPAHFTYLHTEPGLTYQRNRGIAAATGDIIYFFDDDVILTPTYLANIHAIFEQHPAYAGGMGTVRNIGHYTWWVNALRALFLLQRNYSSGKFSWSGWPTHAYGNTQFQDVEVVGGCCMAFRADVLRWHLFDEKLRFYSYMEDVDISWRISRTHRLFYTPHAVLDHNESPLARDKVTDRAAMFIANYTYLFFKNVYPENRLRLMGYCWSVLGLFLEAALLGKWQWFLGYLRGLRHALRHKGRIPYAAGHCTNR